MSTASLPPAAPARAAASLRRIKTDGSVTIFIAVRPSYAARNANQTWTGVSKVGGSYSAASPRMASGSGVDNAIRFDQRSPHPG